MDSSNEILSSLRFALFTEIQSPQLNHLVALFTVHGVRVRINHSYTSILITPNVAAPSKTREMTFLFSVSLHH